MKTKTITINILAVLVLMMPFSLMAQSDWKVSDAKRKDSNPIAYSDKSVKAGKVVFLANCKSCHGDVGKNNGLPLIPKPTDFGEQAFHDANTEGSIFHKITDGRATMPAYGAILSEQQRGDVVNYIRSFDANFKPTASAQVVETPKSNDTEVGAPYFLEVKVDEANSEVSAILMGTFNGAKAPVVDAEIFIGIKRYFNNLPIMEAGAITNEEGVIKAIYPADLPSGEKGIGELVVYVVDQEKFGELNQSAELKLIATHPSHFSETRALWANRGNFPIWLLVTYLSMVLIAWGVMGKVVMNLFKIKKIGN
ncbi:MULTISPECIES: cytochrome c [unclassified Lentimicrobium]|uniref:c-type cytochrome n=1 Tax=unclassified Lentimicrobium TaxID=2677434 RepID=UPI0015530424|nr:MULTISPECIES: cytochrome c [unclassified Lentimicrobium]NPD44406.1 cytochrome c [Lentimicrobium sp. S6]NPD84328.1 cytochrome c [Lentimicrobium sp. L6]